jgi:hypothetical protein
VLNDDQHLKKNSIPWVSEPCTGHVVIKVTLQRLLCICVMIANSRRQRWCWEMKWGKIVAIVLIAVWEQWNIRNRSINVNYLFEVFTAVIMKNSVYLNFLRSDVSKERIFSIIRVKAISELGKNVISNYNVVPSSLILFTLMIEAILSFETWALIRGLLLHITEDGNLLCYCSSGLPIIFRCWLLRYWPHSLVHMH